MLRLRGEIGNLGAKYALLVDKIIFTRLALEAERSDIRIKNCILTSPHEGIIANAVFMDA